MRSYHCVVTKNAKQLVSEFVAQISVIFAEFFASKVANSLTNFIFFIIAWIFKNIHDIRDQREE